MPAGIIFETLSANALLDAMRISIDVGVTETGGKLVLETSGDAEVSLHRFDAPPSFPAAASGTMAVNGTPIDDTSAAGGTVEHYSVYDRNNLKQFEGVVAVSGMDLDLSSLSVGVGDTVSLTAFSLSQT